MNSNVTYGDVVNAFSWLVNPTDSILSVVNRAYERMINSGSWNGCVIPTVFNGSTGYIVLPAHMESIIGVDINGWPQMVFGQFHEYQEMGPGQITATNAGIGPLIAMADAVCSQIQITDAGYLKIFSGASDNGKVVRVFGINQATGQPVFDASGNPGENVTLSSPFAQTVNVYSSFSAFQKPATNGYLTINVLPTDAAIEYQIGSYLPNETRPSYAWYKTGTWAPNIPIACLCRLRFLAVANLTDFVRIGNLAAWEHAIRGILFQDLEQLEKGEKSWALCFQLLNDQHRSAQGKAMRVVNFNPHGVGNYPVWNSY